MQSAVASVHKCAIVGKFGALSEGVCAAVRGSVVGSGAESVWEWWSRERVHKSAEMCVPNRHLDAVVVDCKYLLCASNWVVNVLFALTVLSLLTCASLSEDLYGVV